MKSLFLFTAMFLGLITMASTATAADPASPDIVQITGNLIFTSGSSAAAYTTILTVPSDKRLVIQTISYYRSGAVTGSISNVFIQTDIFGVISYFSAPSITADGSPYPTATLSATFYAGAATTLQIGGYRTGSPTNEEIIPVTISGYYVTRD